MLPNLCCTAMVRCPRHRPSRELLQAGTLPLRLQDTLIPGAGLAGEEGTHRAGLPWCCKMMASGRRTRSRGMLSQRTRPPRGRGVQHTACTVAHTERRCLHQSTDDNVLALSPHNWNHKRPPTRGGSVCRLRCVLRDGAPVRRPSPPIGSVGAGQPGRPVTQDGVGASQRSCRVLFADWPVMARPSQGRLTCTIAQLHLASC